MNAQKSRPIAPRMANRALRPRSFAIVRERAVNHFGSSNRPSKGSGRAGASGIKYLDELACCVLARKPKEDLLESLRAMLRGGPQLGHRPGGANLSLRNDRYAVAQGLRHLERVRAHHD